MTDDWMDWNRGQYSLVRLPEAIRCKPAIFLLVVAFVASAALFGMLDASARVHTGMVIINFLLVLLVFWAGVNAAGIALTTHMSGQMHLGFLDYFLAGLFCIPRIIGAMLLLALAFLLTYLAATLALYICRLPGLGALLVVVVVPVLICVLAALAVSLYLAFVIVLPALWAGEGVLASLTGLFHIVRHYPLQSIAKVFVGTLAALFFGAVLYGLLALGTVQTAFIAMPMIGNISIASIVHDGGLMSGLSGAGTPQLTGAAIGFAIMLLIVAAMVNLLLMTVGVLTWGEYSAKIDLAAVRETVEAKVQSTKNKVQSARERLEEKRRSMTKEGDQTDQAFKGENTSARPDPVTRAAPDLQCPQCTKPVGTTDLFCGNCGHPLKKG